MKNYSRGLFLWVFLALVVMLAFTMMSNTSGVGEQDLGWSQMMQKLQEGQVSEITIKGKELSGTLADGSKFRSVGPTESDVFLQQMNRPGLNATFEPEPNGGLLALLTSALPMVLLFIVLLLFMRQLQVGGGKAMSFGKSRARLMNEGGRRVTFEDVAGVDEAKEELQEVIEFLKDPQKFTRLGGRIPKGVLLMGPPGTGKTLLARAIAGEAGVPFFTISGSDFVEMFVGVGASRVRDLFEQGKKNAPCIIFVDEIDAVGRHRGAGMGGGHDEREQTLNALLVEMDGFESNEGVIMVAATNRPDVLDPALLRPGRFDRRVVVPNPDVKGRLGIFKVHTRKIPLSPSVDLETLAKATPGFSGADLGNLVNEAALLAARYNKSSVEMNDFEAAKDKVSMGAERKGLVLPEEERRRTAYHEAGHAIVAQLMPDADTVHKVTIVPRGRALGVTQILPDEDQYGATVQQLRTRLAIFMGGRAAEEIVMSDFSTGASNDIEQATRIARAMVTRFGMSAEVGPVAIEDSSEEVFLGRDFGRTQHYSQRTAEMVDGEIRRLLDDAYKSAHEVLTSNAHILHRLAGILLEKETVDGPEFQRLVGTLNPVAHPASA